MKQPAFYLSVLFALISCSSVFLPLANINSILGRKTIRAADVFLLKKGRTSSVREKQDWLKKAGNKILSSFQNQLQGVSFKESARISIRNVQYFFIPLGILAGLCAHLLLLPLLLLALLRRLTIFKRLSFLISVFSFMFLLSILALNDFLKKFLAGGINIPLDKGAYLNLNIASGFKFSLTAGLAVYWLMAASLLGSLATNIIMRSASFQKKT